MLSLKGLLIVYKLLYTGNFFLVHYLTCWFFFIRLRIFNCFFFRVSDEENSEASIELVHNGKLSRTMLDSKDCFIVDCNSKGIYCWIGKECTTKEKAATVSGSKALMVKQNYPNYIPLETVIDGGESIAFKSLFKDWNNQL